MQYRVSVNGKSYDVVIELVGGAAPAAPKPAASVPVAPAATVPAAPVASAPAPATSGEEQILCPMPGSIWQVSVSVGQQVEAGEVLIILEAMKMENEIVAPRSGTVKQILVAKGAAVESGDVLVVLS